MVGGGYQGDTGPARPKHFMKRTTLTDAALWEKLDKESLRGGRLLAVARQSAWTEKRLNEAAILSTGSGVAFCILCCSQTRTLVLFDVSHCVCLFFVDFYHHLMSMILITA